MVGNRSLILIIEDEACQRDILKFYLSDAYSLRFAKTGEEALAFFKNHLETIDLILLDINLPDIDGYKLFQKFRSISKSGMPNVIVVTAYDTQNDWIESHVDLQRCHHIGKPYSKETLLKVVNNAIHNNRLVRKEKQNKIRMSLNTILNQRNSIMLSERMIQCAADRRSMTPEEALKLVVQFEDITRHPEGLGYLTSILEKDTGQKAPDIKQPTILFVENEDVICTIKETAFQSRGLSRIIAKSLGEARKIVSEHPDFDIVFVDSNLPDGSGIALLDTLFEDKVQNPHPFFPSLAHPDVVITGSAMDKETMTESMHAGAIAYMTKPIGWDDLFETVEKLGKRRHHLHAIEYLWGVLSLSSSLRPKRSD